VRENLHEHCMVLVDDTIRINHELCSTCTQCIAICPEQALSWDHVPPVAYREALAVLPGLLLFPSISLRRKERCYALPEQARCPEEGQQ